MPDPTDQPGEVLDFWFVQSRLRQRFAKDPISDALVAEPFLEAIRAALTGELDSWVETPQIGLALVLLLDQFPWQIWRDTAMAFSGNARPWR